MTTKVALEQLNILEKKAQALRLRLAWQKYPSPKRKNVWETTAGVMSWQRGSSLLKKINAARQASNKKLQKLLS